MARLNTHLSATPQQTRSSTVDSLYRDPSVAPQRDSNARTSSYSVLSPTRSITSNKENEQPDTRENTPRRGKARGLRGASARMPTPDSGSTAGHGSKRRRTDNYTMAHQSDVYEDGQDEETGIDGDEDEVVTPSQPAPTTDQDEENSKFYDPNQDPVQHRELRTRMRDNKRMIDENRDEMIKPGSMLLDTLKTTNHLFGKVRQTTDAAVDSRTLVDVTDLASKKLNNSLGNTGVGIDLDQFVSKAIYFMKSKGRISGEEDAPTLPVAEDDEDEDADGLDWQFLGRQACFPCNRRPPTSSFLLGPLSVQKRIRTTQRKARSQRQPVGPATRPQEIKEGDIQQNENANTTAICKDIRSKLESHIQNGIDRVEDELGAIPEDELEDQDQDAAFRRHRMAQTEDSEAAVSLLDFAINPRDFGQTVENLFYISFLVKEGNAKVIKDQEGLPLLVPAAPHSVSDHREKNVQKHQAIFSIDYPTWQMFIEAFDIEEPLIPHRVAEDANIGTTGWYNS